MTDKKKVEKVVEEVVEEVVTVEVEVDTDRMTLDDLEMISMYDDGQDVPEWKMTQFLKRVCVTEGIGSTPVKEIESLVTAIFAAIEAQSEPEVKGKN